MIEKVGRQVWQEFAPRDDENLTFHDGNLVEVVIVGNRGGIFNVDPDGSVSEAALHIALQMQTILIEARQEIVPDCPLHPGAHPLDSTLVDGAPAWAYPATEGVVRYMDVSDEA